MSTAELRAIENQPHEGRPARGSPAPRPNAARPRWVYRLLPFLLTLLCLSALAYGIAASRFGSLKTAMRYLAGERLILEPTGIEMHDLAVGKVRTTHLDFTNYSGRPVSILGASTPCTCLLVSNVPTTVAPGKSIRIPVEITGRDDKQRLDEWITLFTESTIKRSFRVHVVATTKPDSSADSQERTHE